jgi:hypothetical protein
MKPKKLATHIAESFSPTSQPIELKLLCVEILIREESRDASDALEIAEQRSPMVLDYLQRLISAAEMDGYAERFELNSSSSNYIQGSCFCAPTDDAATVASKKLRANSWSYAIEIEKLNPIQFESLCCKLLSLMGVKSAQTTKRSGDEGVDFFGQIQLANELFGKSFASNFSHKIYIWIVGQAKHYKRLVSGTPELRDLFGSIELAKAGVTNPVDPVQKLDRVKIADPVIYMFITSGKISKIARSLLAASGVFGVDGRMVETFLSDHGVALDPNGVVDAADFNRWVDS